MTTRDQLKDDLDYVSRAVRHNDASRGEPLLYVFWAVAVLVGFASADFAPRYTGPYWLVVGIGGGLFSGWYGARQQRLRGIRNRSEGKRWGLHWLVGGIAFFLTALPMFTGAIDPKHGAPQFLLTTGIVYGLAGVHLDRPLLWCGLIALAGYAALLLLHLPYAWTATGVVMAACLLLAAYFTARAGRDAQ